ncbi:hypothetical protein Nepgr_022868 [Nepenthes gracilis]|uniref:Uncharacterized protein n=1 Tax=Nepenthes gracilis TaxID=150966 RepID=A0AAD3T1R6_NEPGR|nr:hypothetical protein Nepgr_022868 [Nepenthes gracilis]
MLLVFASAAGFASTPFLVDLLVLSNVAYALLSSCLLSGPLILLKYNGVLMVIHCNSKEYRSDVYVTYQRLGWPLAGSLMLGWSDLDADFVWLTDILGWHYILPLDAVTIAGFGLGYMLALVERSFASLRAHADAEVGNSTQCCCSIVDVLYLDLLILPNGSWSWVLGCDP